ncbi:MAG: hypothetical protein ABSE73_23040 [Planctomycetota bacterium]
MELNYGESKPVDRSERARIRKALLLGLGMDNKDGHVRITTGPNFHLLGGSQNTHEVMQETAIKLNEELHRRGKRLEDLSPKEFIEIMRELE